MQTCATCKYFLDYVGGRAGLCMLIGEWTETPARVSTDGHAEEDLYLSVIPDKFGCILHEEKTDANS